MKDEELKKLVEEVIGNNDPYWNIPVYEIVKKIIDLPDGTETSITKLSSNSQFTSKQLFDIYTCVNRACRRIDIVLDFSKENAKVAGLLYNLPFMIRKNKKSELSTKKILHCPNCGERLVRLMPDGLYLSCNKCNKYYSYDNGNVGKETASPYNRNDVLY